MSDDTFYIDIDSKNRDRNNFPDVSQFSIPFEINRTTKNKNNSNDPVSDSYPTHEWQWNSQPHITIINGSFGYNSATNVPVLGGSGTGMTVDIIADGFLPMASSIKTRTHYKKTKPFDDQDSPVLIEAGNSLLETYSEQNNINSVIDTNYAFELTSVGTGFINDDNFTNFSRTTGIGNFDTGTSFRVSTINCVRGGIEIYTINTAGTGYSVGDIGIFQTNSPPTSIGDRNPSFDAVYKVTSISGSASTGPVTGIDILYCGEGYSPTNLLTLRTNGDGNAIIRVDTVTSIGTNNTLGNIQAIYMNTTDISGTGFKDGDLITFTSPSGGRDAVYTVRKSGLCNSKVSKITINNHGHGYIPGETVYLDSMSSNFGLVITDLGSGYKDGGAIKTQSITTAGTGYAASETGHLTEVGDFHTLKYAKYLITSVGGSGEVTGVDITDPGKGYKTNDILLLDYNDNRNAKITVTSIYGEDVSTIGGSGTGLTVDYTTNAGIIDRLTINNQGSSYVDGDILHVLGEKTLTGVTFDFTGGALENLFTKASHGFLTGMYVAITAGTIPSNHINFSLNTRYYFIKVSDNTFQLALPTSNTTVITGTAPPGILSISDMSGLTLTQVTGPSFMLQNCKFRVGESFDVNVDEYFISKSTDMILTATSTSGSGTGMKIKLGNINRVLSSPLFNDGGCDFQQAGEGGIHDFLALSPEVRAEDSWCIRPNGGQVTNGFSAIDFSVGDVIIFPVSGGGADGFSINTQYFITSFIQQPVKSELFVGGQGNANNCPNESVTVTLSQIQGGDVIQGTSDSTGGSASPSWSVCSYEMIIEFIYDIGSGYEIGDTVTFTNNLGNSVTLTLSNSTIFGASLNNDNFVTDTGIRGFNNNQIFINDGVTKGLHVFDNFYKGLIFENITQGTSSRIEKYDHSENIITLEYFIPITLTDVWRIQNPTTKNKIFIPGGSDNDNDYVGDFYQAVMFTGNSNCNTNNTFGGVINQTRSLSDNRTISQFQKIIKYDGKKKIATLENSLHSFTNCSNQMSLQQDIILSSNSNRPSTLFFKESGSFINFFPNSVTKTVIPTSYTGNSNNYFGTSGSGYELNHKFELLGTAIVTYYTDSRFLFSLGVDYKMFDTVQYTLSNDVTSEDIISILFTRLLVKGVKGSISMNRIRKKIPLLPTHNSSIIQGLEKNDSMSVSTDKNEFVISRVKIIDGGSGFVKGDQILLLSSFWTNRLALDLSSDGILQNILDSKTVNGLTILSVEEELNGKIISLDIKSSFPMATNLLTYPDKITSFNNVVVPDQNLITSTFYPVGDQNFNNDNSFYAFVMSEGYDKNPSSSFHRKSASGAVIEVTRQSNTLSLPGGITENSELSFENSFVYVPYYNTKNGYYIHCATYDYIVVLYKDITEIGFGESVPILTGGIVKSVTNHQNFNRLCIPQRCYKITADDLSTNRVSVKYILNGDFQLRENANFVAESQNAIKTVYEISNKLLINYGETFSQFRTLDTTQTITNNSKTINPERFIISKFALAGLNGFQGLPNFTDIRPFFTIKSDEFILNCIDTPYEIIQFSKDNNVTLTHNKVLQKPNDIFKINLQQLILPNKIQGKYLYNQKYLMLEFSNEDTINTTVYSSNQISMRNVLFKCIPINDFNELNKFVYFKSDDYHNIQINLNNNFRFKIMLENGNIIIPNEKENCLIKNINENIQISSLFKLDRIKIKEEMNKKKKIIKKPGQVDINIDINDKDKTQQQIQQQTQQQIQQQTQQRLQEEYEQELILQEEYEQEQRLQEELQKEREQELLQQRQRIQEEFEQERQILIQQELQRRFEEDLNSM